MEFHPAQFDKKTRSKHVLQALLYYNHGIIQNNPSGASAKFKRLTVSPFVFMRGTADLMYRDLEGTDADQSILLCVGDVHLENFGVMEAETGKLIWGLNDFDEAAFAPFTWDVKRGAVSVVLAARENGFDKKQRWKLARAFAKAYIQQIEKGFVDFEKEIKATCIKDLLKAARKINGKKWLEKKYLQDNSPIPQFKISEEIQPLARIFIKERKAIIQAALDNYLRSLDQLNTQKPQNLKVLDIATKAGSGTASIGLWRYYALVEVEIEAETELMILEIKQERPSVLAPYIDIHPISFASEGERVAYAENVYLPNANPYYGFTDIGESHYLVRKRSPYKSRVNLIELDDYKAFKSYVKACGQVLADAHLRSNIELYGEQDTAKLILQSVEKDGFDDVIAFFAIKMAKQVRRDWKSFLKYYKKGIVL